ncbi:sugar ABC transporter substrate-binding protein, partial [Neobacillus drentensis]|uniref:sugar ABC transporter substrate-binding protein n=1 Tax=Neobacillus drentensis TaxID=220684 RepID=UPI002FFDE77E
MLKKIKLSILLFSIVGLILSGCSNSQETSSSQGQKSSGNVYQWGDSNFEKLVRETAQGKTLKIGFAPPAASEHYDIFIHSAYTMMNEIHDRFGVNFEFEVAAPDDFSSVERQVATIENWTSLGFDAILVCSGGDFDSMNAVYEKARKKGTEIYLFNYPAELWNEKDLKATAAITYNNEFQSGYQVGKYAAEKLKGKGNIVLIWGVPGYWATSRKKGFEEAISEFPGMKIVAEQRGDYVRDKGMSAAENLLQSNPKVDLIYGENEEMALGAVQAVKSRGLKLWDGKKGIMVIGADGLNSGFDSIRQGELTATVDVGTVDMGRELIRNVFMHQVLGYSIDKIQNVPTVVVDKKNV